MCIYLTSESSNMLLSGAPVWIRGSEGGACVILITLVKTLGKEKFLKCYTSFTERDPADTWLFYNSMIKYMAYSLPNNFGSVINFADSNHSLLTTSFVTLPLESLAIPLTLAWTLPMLVLSWMPPVPLASHDRKPTTYGKPEHFRD